MSKTKIKTKPHHQTIIHIGADHRGYCLKYHVKRYLHQKGYEVIDHGNHHYNSTDDYPDYANEVTIAIQTKPNTIGILICGSGIGMDIVANKTKCIRAALCWNNKVAISARHDDDPNILVLPADFITQAEAKKTVNKFLNTKFSGKTKHIRRIKKILTQEKCQKKS
jgi:ribose 5-phosphate isomerase B